MNFTLKLSLTVCREYKVEANVGQPQVAYRETISKTFEIDYQHKKQSGGAGQYAKVKLIFEPQERGAGFTFENKVVGGAVPKEYIPGVEKVYAMLWIMVLLPGSQLSTLKRH